MAFTRPTDMNLHLPRRSQTKATDGAAEPGALTVIDTALAFLANCEGITNRYAVNLLEATRDAMPAATWTSALPLAVDGSLVGTSTSGPLARTRVIDILLDLRNAISQLQEPDLAKQR